MGFGVRFMTIVLAGKTRLSLIVAAITATGILAGCTTTQPVQSCTPKDRSRLVSQIAPTKARLDRNKNELARVRTQLSKERCIGGAFSPKAKSPRCSRLQATADRLQSEIKTLEGRLAELNAVVAGRGSSSVYVQACTASWLASRKTKKVVKEPKRKASSVRHAALPTTDLAETPNPDYTATSTAETHPVAYTPTDTPLTDKVQEPAMSKSQPATIAPPPERPYTGNSNVRVVGSSFFPDQSTPANRPTPAHEPVP